MPAKLFLAFSSRRESDSFLRYPTNPLKLTPKLSAFYNEVWGNYLIPRDVIYSPDIKPNCKYGVKFYNLAFFARQFGHTQMIPLEPFNSLNSDFTDHDIIIDRAWADKVKAKYFEQLKTFSFTPFQEFPYSTDHF